MAVYTLLKKEDIEKTVKDFHLGSLKKYYGIKEGIENTNYYIQTNKTKAILTIFEKRVQKKDLPFFSNLMLSLKKAGVLCPKPFHKNKKIIFHIKNKSAILVSFLEGRPKNKLSDKDCIKIGKEIGTLHRKSKNLKLFRKNSLSLNDWIKIFSKVKKYFPIYQKEMKNYFELFKKNCPNNIEKGIIHADIFPDNIFFNKNKFSGFIDFYFACNDYFMYEIAIAINSICFDKKKLNLQKAKALIKGYSQVKKISFKEINYLPILCLGAAIRFFVTRLYDYKFTPKKAKVKKKDPKEYLFKMRFFAKKINEIKFHE